MFVAYNATCQVLELMKTFTHIAKIYGFKCYFNENTGEIEGTNYFTNLMIELFVWIDVTFTTNETFAIKIIEKL
jgi:hypothetical protein